MANTVKLDTNVPVVGIVKQVWYQKSTKEGYSDQLKLVGTWDGKGDGNMYVHLATESVLQQQGIIGARSGDSFPVLGQAVKIQVVKKEEGGKKFTEITRLSGAPSSGGAPVNGGGSQGTYSAPPAQSIGDPKLYWQKLQLTMTSCIKTAGQLLGNTKENVIDDAAIVGCAVALFQERCRNGLLSSPPPPLADQKLKDEIAQGCIKLNKDEAWLKEELLRQGCTDINKITVEEANKVISSINAAIAAAEAAKAAPPAQGSFQYGSQDIPF